MLYTNTPIYAKREQIGDHRLSMCLNLNLMLEKHLVCKSKLHTELFWAISLWMYSHPKKCLCWTLDLITSIKSLLQ